MIRIFEAQRLISLSSIFDLVDQLESLAKGEKANNALITKTRRANLRDPASTQLAERLGEKRPQFRILAGEAY
jgi:hypothetical protein